MNSKKSISPARFNMVHYDLPAIFEAIPTLKEAPELFRAQDKVRLSLRTREPCTMGAAAILSAALQPGVWNINNPGKMERFIKHSAPDKG